MKYIAGFNQPGYLPDSEPEEFDTFEDARDYLVEELTHAAGGAEGELGEDLEIDAENVAEYETGPFSYTASDDYVYWVAQE